MSAPETPCSSKSEPSIFGLLAGLTAAWRVITSSKPYFAASTREMSQCADLICTRILRRFRVARASFNPTPNFPMTLPAFLAFQGSHLRQVFIVDTTPKVSDMPVTRAICADDDILGVRQHLFIECVRYHLPNCVLYLPPFKNLFDIQIEISGFIRLHADRVPSFGYFRGRNARSRSIARMNPFSVSV